MSRAVTVDIPHDLGRAEARRRIDEGFGQLAAQLHRGVAAADRRWEGDRLVFALKALGQAVSGAIEVSERNVRVEVLLPAVLAVIADAVKGRLRKEGQVLLEHRRH